MTALAYDIFVFGVKTGNSGGIIHGSDPTSDTSGCVDGEVCAGVLGEDFAEGAGCGGCTSLVIPSEVSDNTGWEEGIKDTSAFSLIVSSSTVALLCIFCSRSADVNAPKPGKCGHGS